MMGAQKAVEGIWLFQDGSPLTYINWASWEPNNNGQNTGIFISSGKMFDEVPTNEKAAVCKRGSNN